MPSGNGGRKIGGLFLEGLPEGPLFELRLSGQKRRPVQACERQQHGTGITIQELTLPMSESDPAVLLTSFICNAVVPAPSLAT